jgi:hypothetical protein
MGQFSIYVQGNASFISEILHAVVAMYQTGSTMLFSGLILLLGLLIFTVKYTLDNEKNPHPLREFFLGVVLFMFFVHPATTPKFDVLVEPIDGSHNVYPVNDVPFLAAVPAWVATGIFVPIIKEYQLHFSNVYSTSSDLAQPGNDPLTAIVHMHSVNPNDIAFQSGLVRTFDEFIKRCYVEPSVINNIDVVSPEELKSMPSHEMLQALEPSSNNWFESKNYLASNGGEEQSCSEVHAALNGALSPGGSNISTMATHFTSLGVNINSMNMLGQVLGDPNAPTPQQLMLGRWLSYKVAEGVQGTQLEHAFGRGIFEAKQQRLYQRAGERSMFLQVMKPMITALEGFVFFLAPIMMLLVVLGGMGIAFIGKYLMILLFTNLWAVIAVFVNMLSYESVRDALKTMPGAATNDPAAAPSADMLFSMANELSSIQEIEGQLVVAATMTAAIPSLAIFMLYGGVHSLMGVMGKFGGNYDGKSAAPDLTQTTPDGRTALMNHVVGMGADGRGYAAFNGAQDNTGVEISGGQALSQGSTALRQHAQQQVSSSGNEFLTKATDALKSQSAVGSGTTITDGSAVSSGSAYQDTAEALEAYQSQSGMSGEQATKFFNEVSGGSPGFIKDMFGISGKMGQQYSDAVKAASSDTSTMSDTEKENLAEVFNSMDSSQMADTVSKSNLIGEGSGWEEANAAKESFNDSQSALKSWSTSSADARSAAAGVKLNGRDVDLMTDDGALRAINSQLGKDSGNGQSYADRLRDSGLGHVMDGDRFDAAKLSEYGGLNAVTAGLMADETVDADEKAANMATAGMLYTELANNTSSSGAGGVAALGRSFTAAGQYDAPDVSNANTKSGTAVTDGTGVSKAGIDKSKQDIEADKAKLDGKFANGKSIHDLQSAKVQDKLAEKKGELTGNVPEHFDRYDGFMAPFGQDDGIENNARVGEFMAIDSGQENVAGVKTGLEHLLGGGNDISDLYDKASKTWLGSSTNWAGEARHDLMEANAAAEFLSTDAGKQYFNSLDANNQQAVLDSMAMLEANKADSGINFTAPSDTDGAGYRQSLYNANRSNLSDKASSGERYDAYNAADYFTNRSTTDLPGLFNAPNPNGWRGQTQGDLRNFGGQNAEAIKQIPSANGFNESVDRLSDAYQKGQKFRE